MPNIPESVQAFLLNASYDELIIEADVSRENGDHEREHFVNELLADTSELVGLDLYLEAAERDHEETL
jgi:hypothetical protein